MKNIYKSIWPLRTEDEGWGKPRGKKNLSSLSWITVYKCIALTTVGKRGTAGKKDHLGLLSGQAFYSLGPQGNAGGSNHRVQSRPHTQLPDAFSLTVPALHQLGEDMEGGRWAEDIRPIPKAQSVQNT